MVHHYHPSDDAYGLLMCAFVIFIILAGLSFLLGIFTYTIYMIYLTILVFILVKIIERYVKPNDTCMLTALIPLIITLIIGHMLFNATIYFEPVPHRPYTPDFCMKTTDGKTFSDAYFGLPTTHIYIPFTKIHIYNPGKTTYYPDNTQYGWSSDQLFQPYTVIARDSIPLKVGLAWRFTLHKNTYAEYKRIFYERGPDWEKTYATSIVTQQLAQNIASQYRAADIESPSMSVHDKTLLKVQTKDFTGYIAIDYTYEDTAYRDCMNQRDFNSIGPSSADNREIYGEPNESPKPPVDKCAQYDIQPVNNQLSDLYDITYDDPSPVTSTNTNINRITLRPKRR